MNRRRPRHRAQTYLEHVWNRLRHPAWLWGAS